MRDLYLGFVQQIYSWTTPLRTVLSGLTPEAFPFFIELCARALPH